MLGTSISGGITSSARLVQASLLHSPGPMHLTPQPRGSFASLVAAPLSSTQPGPGQVLLSVQAVGLNFRDVLNVLGMYPGDPGEPGGDVSGIVMAVGAGAERLHK